MNSDDIRQSVARQLLTDRLLGVRAAPLTWVAAAPEVSVQAARSGRATPARPAGAAAAPRDAAPAPARALSRTSAAGPSAPLRILQTISEAELARRAKELRALDEGQVSVCTHCKLCELRTRTVFGQGHAGARLMFVGEAPGADEDRQGLAFVGKAGQLLTKMIEAMGVTRDQVFICNILKCRPPENRDPAPDEISACWPYLDQQIRTIQPEAIVALGKPASQTLLRTSEGIGRLRGRWHPYYASGMPGMGPATPLMPTFHPAYLLRSPGEKGKTWSDLQMVMQRLEWPVPEKSDQHK